MIERATSYINGVLSGEIISGKWIRLAMERHVNDMKRQNTPDFPYYFDEDEAARVLSMYKLFRFSKGKFAGQSFDLMGWWAAMVYMAFGWRRSTGGKRFKKIYCKVARGNAKTENLVSVGTIGFLFEGVPDAEVYWVAMVKEQAKIGWGRQKEALTLLVEDYPELASEIHIPEGRTSSHISRQSGLSFITYYGQNTKGRDGLSPSLALCDEYHEWEHNAVMDRIESGMVKVEDPSTWIITTGGYNPDGPNGQFLAACKNILEGVAPNDEVLAFIFELDEGDDWRDESVWPKANPALFHLSYRDVLLNGIRTEFNKIKTEGISKEIEFQVKNMNIEHAGKRGWMSDEIWMRGSVNVPDSELVGRKCWAGLDLANTSDFNSFVLFWPAMSAEENDVVRAYYWIPESAVDQHKLKRPFVQRWISEGHINVTLGNVTDYDVIREDIGRICAGLQLQRIAFDSKFAAAIVPRLVEDGFTCEPLQQSWAKLTPAVQYVERSVVGEMIYHGGNPVLRWNMRNVVMQYDRNQNALPSKGASADKIDGVAAMLNAVGQFVEDYSDPEKNQSSYLFEKDAEIIMF